MLLANRLIEASSWRRGFRTTVCILVLEQISKEASSVSWLAALVSLIDRKIGWFRLPLPLGIQVLDGVRSFMRAKNLYDTSTLPIIPQPAPQPQGVSYLTARTADGTFNDLQYPLMGSAGTRFGHLFPLENAYPEPEPAILEPSPRGEPQTPRSQ